MLLCCGRTKIFLHVKHIVHTKRNYLAVSLIKHIVHTKRNYLTVSLIKPSLAS
jgi:hypothetical protein